MVPVGLVSARMSVVPQPDAVDAIMDPSDLLNVSV